MKAARDSKTKAWFELPDQWPAQWIKGRKEEKKIIICK